MLVANCNVIWLCGVVLVLDSKLNCLCIIESLEVSQEFSDGERICFGSACISAFRLGKEGNTKAYSYPLL